MFPRFGLCLILLPMLAACSTVPNRYAPWRGNEPQTGGPSPNLADVPAAPNVDATKAEIEAMRQRMEADRNNAYQAVQGANAGVISSTNLPLPAQTDTQSYQNAISGDVIYNYDPGQGGDYTYGHTAEFQQLAPTVANNDPSVSVDLSVIGADSDSAPALSPYYAEREYAAASSSSNVSSGLTLGQPIAYFAHGSTKLNAKDRKAIAELAAQIKSSAKSVTIIGSASKRTGINNVALSRAVNLKMSAKRAEVVMQEFIRNGVSPEQLYISAYGDTLPGKREEIGSEADDRRVEVIY